MPIYTTRKKRKQDFINEYPRYPTLKDFVLPEDADDLWMVC